MPDSTFCFSCLFVFLGGYSRSMPDSVQQLVLWLIPLAPLAAAVVTAALGPKWLGQRSHLPCWFGLAVAAVCSLVLLQSIVPERFGDHSGTPVVAAGYEWISTGGMSVRVDLQADAMTAFMLAMVTSVSLLVAVFAAGYMHGDPGYPRFFAEVSLFVFSMCMLVLAGNFLLLFVFWEGVGLCSYLLIGFWYRRPSAAAAAKKAFVVNRIGDFGFLLGIFLIWTTFGSLDFADVLHNPQATGEYRRGATGPGHVDLLVVVPRRGGKIAQFPLHVWLPDAMEGPTPVSALIHAATMVTAGVYVVARCTPLFVLAPTAHLVVSGIGATTALLAALIALTQFDLKRVLAYSTVSQLGYMFMALGAGAAGPEAATAATTAGMFHLFTHAFFKALLFLAAGSVMHAMGDVIDMRRFGGLRRALPITHWTFLCGAAALAGFPFLSGFWSKDDILAVLHGASEHAALRQLFLCHLSDRIRHRVAHGVLHVPRIFHDILGRRAVSGGSGASSARSSARDGLAAARIGDLRRGGWNCRWADALVRELFAPYSRLAGRRIARFSFRIDDAQRRDRARRHRPGLAILPPVTGVAWPNCRDPRPALSRIAQQVLF